MNQEQKELRLTRREKEVLQWACQGKTNDETAAILGISKKTVEYHAGSVLEKLDVKNRTAAVYKAIGLGLIPPPNGVAVGGGEASV